VALIWDAVPSPVGIMPPDFRFLDRAAQPDVILAVPPTVPNRLSEPSYARARAPQARRHAGAGDPFRIGAAALFVPGVAFAAGFLPGRSATRQHPLAALHYD
jgi:hypothetical protein